MLNTINAAESCYPFNNYDAIPVNGVSNHNISGSVSAEGPREQLEALLAELRELESSNELFPPIEGCGMTDGVVYFDTGVDYDCEEIVRSLKRRYQDVNFQYCMTDKAGVVWKQTSEYSRFSDWVYTVMYKHHDGTFSMQPYNSLGSIFDDASRQFGADIRSIEALHEHNRNHPADGPLSDEMYIYAIETIHEAPISPVEEWWRSVDLKIRNDNRWVVVDHYTKQALSTAQGYGFKSAEAARRYAMNQSWHVVDTSLPSQQALF